MLDNAKEAASRAQVDVVLVLEDERDFALAQVLRNKILTATGRR